VADQKYPLKQPVPGVRPKILRRTLGAGIDEVWNLQFCWVAWSPPPQSLPWLDALPRVRHTSMWQRKFTTRLTL
jgi:hypothetical protein